MSAFDPTTYAWAPCVPELLVENFQTSLAFYKSLGFIDMYQRENFAYLDYHGAQLMIAQRDNYWETAEMVKPYGRGINLQFATHELDHLLTIVHQNGYTLYQDRYEKWRDLGCTKGGSSEFLILDPDGYLIRFLQKI